MAEISDADVQQAVQAIAARLLADLDRLAVATVEFYAANNAEYRALQQTTLYEDVGAVTRANLESFLQSCAEPGEEYAIEVTRIGLSRRARQGVSLEATLKTIRLWMRFVFSAVRDAANPADPVEQAAALRMGEAVIRYADGFSAIAEEHWIQQARGVWSDQEVARRDLVELLIAGRGDREAARRQAAVVGASLTSDYVVVAVREASATRAALRPVLELVRDHLPAPAISVLRYGEVVALYPVARFADVAALEKTCHAMVEPLRGVDAKLGIGSWHPGLAGVPTSYDEARRAALRADGDRRVLGFDDLVLDQLLSRGPQPQLESLLRRLRDHDAQSRSDLAATLRVFVASGFSPARSAVELHVHPNTVVYRLKRIQEVTGRDPRDPDDLLILALAMKLDELTAD